MALGRLPPYPQPESEEGIYSAKLSYTVDLVTPEDTLEDIDYGLVDESREEEIMDISIDIQFEMDSSYVLGDYKIIFHVTDDYNQKELSMEKEFKLE